MNIAWVAIELPVVGDRQVLVKDEQNLKPGQNVVIECVPNPLMPERYLFRMVEVLMRNPTVATKSRVVPRSKSCVQRRSIFIVRRDVAAKK